MSGETERREAAAHLPTETPVVRIESGDMAGERPTVTGSDPPAGTANRTEAGSNDALPGPQASLESTSTPLPPAASPAVKVLAATDPQPLVRDRNGCWIIGGVTAVVVVLLACLAGAAAMIVRMPRGPSAGAVPADASTAKRSDQIARPRNAGSDSAGERERTGTRR